MELFSHGPLIGISVRHCRNHFSSQDLLNKDDTRILESRPHQWIITLFACRHTTFDLDRQPGRRTENLPARRRNLGVILPGEHDKGSGLYRKLHDNLVTGQSNHRALDRPGETTTPPRPESR